MICRSKPVKTEYIAKSTKRVPLRPDVTAPYHPQCFFQIALCTSAPMFSMPMSWQVREFVVALFWYWIHSSLTLLSRLRLMSLAASSSNHLAISGQLARTSSSSTPVISLYGCGFRFWLIYLLTVTMLFEKVQPLSDLSRMKITNKFGTSLPLAVFSTRCLNCDRGVLCTRGDSCLTTAPKGQQWRCEVR